MWEISLKYATDWDFPGGPELYGFQSIKKKKVGSLVRVSKLFFVPMKPEAWTHWHERTRVSLAAAAARSPVAGSEGAHAGNPGGWLVIQATKAASRETARILQDLANLENI